MLRSLISAFLMYSRIPMPQVEWKEENRRYSLGFFPLVGAVCGGLLILLRAVCDMLNAGQLIFAAAAVFLPVLVTGGIHLDGFCDVTDALSSFAGKEKRLEILSDPHIGSFAVMRLCLYLILQTALFTCISGVKETAAVACGYVISRALSGLSAVCFKAAKKEGTLHSFVQPSHQNITIAMETAFIAGAGAAAVVMFPIRGMVCLAVCAAVLFYCRRTAYKNFGGYTGDVCGWSQQLCEIWYLTAFVLTKLITEAIV